MAFAGSLTFAPPKSVFDRRSGMLAASHFCLGPKVLSVSCCTTWAIQAENFVQYPLMDSWAPATNFAEAAFPSPAGPPAASESSDWCSKRAISTVSSCSRRNIAVAASSSSAGSSVDPPGRDASSRPSRSRSGASASSALWTIISLSPVSD